jgi:hypothetical protein
MSQHFIYPTYGDKLTTSVIIRAEDFQGGGMWYPKWLSVEGNHFFLMLLRSVKGLWASWVSMLGNEDEAKGFASRITFFKGTKCISGIYPVHSIRVTQDEVMKSEKLCLLTSDDMIKTVSHIEENFVTGKCLFLDFKIGND